MNSSSKPLDIAALDPLAAGIFNAPNSAERSARLREWLLSDPAEGLMADVYKDLSGRDKGVAKLLKEKLDEIKRSHGQEALAVEWAHKAEQLLQAPRLNMADALAWQRDAAKAGAPLSREPLAGFKQRLTEVVKGVEDLQHQVMVQREVAVLLAQRIEVLSTKPLGEALGGQTGLQADVAQWQNQAQALSQNAVWPSVDLKYPSQLEAAGKQLQAVWDGFSAAAVLASTAQSDAAAPLPPVPVWADEIRRLRGDAHPPVSLASEPEKLENTDAHKKADKAGRHDKAEKTDKVLKPKVDPAQRQALREQAIKAVTHWLEALEKQITLSEGAALPEATTALRGELKTHAKNLDASLDERLHKALTAGGDAEGWQRWLADQVRSDLVNQAEALLDAEKAPTVGGRKMQDKLRQLRDGWKQIDQGGLPNHALWKRFDAACNEAYKTVLAWLEQMKKDAADQRSQRLALMEEVKEWTASMALSEDWRAQLRALHQFADRWRNAGHLSEKAFGEMQGHWKSIFKAAAARLEAAQKASIDRRQAMILEAQEVAAAPALRVDAVKALQQRWQQEAQLVPLDRKTEQKLWEVFRAPLDEAFQRKGTDRPQTLGPVSAHDRAVIDASTALDAANASGDGVKIRAAVSALELALRGQAAQAAAPTRANAQAPKIADAATAKPADEALAEGSAVSLANDHSASESVCASVTADGSDALQVSSVDAETTVAESNTASAAAPALPVAPVKPAKPVVAVRGDDRPGQKRAEAPAGRDGRRDARPGERSSRPGGDRFGERAPRADFREDRGPRLGDTAFRAQREALERAEMSLRKLAAQAHGETLTQLLSAWQERQAEQLPSVQQMGKAIQASTRQAWAQAVASAPQSAASTALLRLEIAAEVPTPADHQTARRALQLQLLTQRNQPGPSETWALDVAQVLAGPHQETAARRLQNALKNLLRN